MLDTTSQLTFHNLIYHVLLKLFVGRGLTLRLIRDSPECDGLEQLKPIDQNLQYDFNFQQFIVLPEEVTIYPVRLYQHHASTLSLNARSHPL